MMPNIFEIQNRSSCWANIMLHSPVQSTLIHKKCYQAVKYLFRPQKVGVIAKHVVVGNSHKPSIALLSRAVYSLIRTLQLSRVKLSNLST